MIALRGTQDERLALMELAAEAGLPIEAVNSAADFFVRKIADWRDQLVELHRGPRATIFRPTPTLYLLLKLGRLTETDLDDCLALIAHCRDTSEGFDRVRVIDALDCLPEPEDAALANRRSSLRDAL